MTVINISDLGRSVSTKLGRLGEVARNFSDRVDYALNQLTTLFSLNFGTRSAGSVYAFARITKPGVWTTTPRRADFAIRT